jgi:hypothetical protein
MEQFYFHVISTVSKYPLDSVMDERPHFLVAAIPQ